MSDYLDPNNQELLKDFFAEARAQVDALEQNILVLENDPANSDAVDEIFRAAHTLKGGAGTVEMTELAGFTHVMEDLLDAIRSKVVSVDEDVIDALLSGIDVIKAMLDSRADGAPYSGDTSAEHDRLQSFIPAKKGKQAPAPAKPKPTPASAAAPAAVAGAPVAHVQLTEYEMLEMREAAGTDRMVYLVSVDFDESNVMNTVSAIHAFAALRESGTVLKTDPDFESLYEDVFYPTVKYYVATKLSVDELTAAVTLPDVVTAVQISTVSTEGAGSPPSAAQAAPARAVSTPAPAPNPVEATPTPAPSAAVAPPTVAPPTVAPDAP
ncbi:MAG: Hpt domain-containing protein, partial [Spirochaetales bacterium]|nr:Hpt domain-containing protein [Spirochaetales bacterium]